MTEDRLSILSISHLPPSPPRFGAQARMHGLLSGLGRRHDLTAVALVDGEFDLEECRQAMAGYCHEVILVPSPRRRSGLARRTLQLRSLTGRHSFEHLLYSVPAVQQVVDGIQRRRRFDVVNLEFPYLGHLRLKQSPAGTPPPVLVIDSHEIAYDMVRQFARKGGSAWRSLYGSLNWRKLRREELSAYAAADGVFVCSQADQERVLAEVPSARTVVIPNAADVDFYQPRPSDPPGDGHSVVYFGLMSTLPNVDGILWFVREIWPRITAARPEARLRILGKGAPRSVLDLAGPTIELVGFVEDLRPHLASAAALVVPLRLGGGTRLKIVEGMAMARPIVSTTLGAEGIDALPERDILIADDPVGFAAAVVRLLADPVAAARLGASARRLAVQRYAWSSAVATLEAFYREIVRNA